jgi:chloramphenicol 3-O phosphotransferase
MKQISLIAAFIAISLSFIFLYMPDSHRSQEPCLINPIQKGTIILVNGVPSADKKALLQELPKILDEPYITVDLDTFLAGAMPDEDHTDNFIIKEKLTQAAHGMHKALTALADEQNNSIVDYTLYDPNWLSHLTESLYGYPVYLVGIKTPHDAMELKEKKELIYPEEPEALHDAVHKKMEYDVVIDSSELSPHDAAQKIKEYIETQQPRSLDILYKKFFS